MGRALPILFNTDMVRAVLDGRKTVTRRVIRYKYSNTEMKMHTDKYGTRLIEIQKDIEGETHGKNPDGSTWHKLLGYINKEPLCRKGDILYVRETFKRNKDGYSGIDFGGYIYKADCKTVFKDPYNPWTPSIHMPKEAARIWLKVTDVRVERLCSDIREADCIEEGISPYKSDMTEKTEIEIEYEFEDLWNSTIKKSDLHLYGFDADPWVWVIEFERCEKPEGM